MRFACSFVALFVLAACGDEPDSTAPAPETPVVEAQAEPVLCRPEGVEPASLSIGPLDFEPGDVIVEVGIDESSGKPVLFFGFTEEAAESLARVTTELVGQPVPVVIDGDTVMSPIVQAPILGGSMQLTGMFSKAELDDLAERLSPPCVADG